MLQYFFKFFVRDVLSRNNAFMFVWFYVSIKPFVCRII